MSVHHTMGGVVINKESQVIDRRGNPIPNLYAAGEVTGGIHGANRLGGNAIADCLTFGRLVGKRIALQK
jgi:fumarate reductase flavoprotein subunit/urocanate reductase